MNAIERKARELWNTQGGDLVFCEHKNGVTLIQPGWYVWLDEAKRILAAEGVSHATKDSDADVNA